MSKLVTAEYLAENNMLQLDEPLEGIRDHQTVRLHVHTPVSVSEKLEPPQGLAALRGIMSEEDAAEMKAIIDEMFPPWND